MFGTDLLRSLIVKIKYALDLKEYYHVSWLIKSATRGTGLGHSVVIVRGGLYMEDFESFIEMIASKNGEKVGDLTLLSLTKIN